MKNPIFDIEVGESRNGYHLPGEFTHEFDVSGIAALLHDQENPHNYTIVGLAAGDCQLTLSTVVDPGDTQQHHRIPVRVQ